jgi:hypothetical protein
MPKRQPHNIILPAKYTANSKNGKRFSKSNERRFYVPDGRILSLDLDGRDNIFPQKLTVA